MQNDQITLGTELADKLFLTCMPMIHFMKTTCDELMTDSYTPDQAKRDLEYLNKYDEPDVREILKQIIALDEVVRK